MSRKRISVMGIFDNENQAASAVHHLKKSAYALERVHSPIPSHVIADALQLPKSKVGWFTLCGGIIGFFTGFALAAFTATRWDLIVGGKPVVALIPFFIVGFEFTILFAVFGNVLGFISQARLPRFEVSPGYDPAFSADRFGILASCAADDKSALSDFFKSRGAEIKLVDTAASGRRTPSSGMDG